MYNLSTNIQCVRKYKNIPFSSSFCLHLKNPLSNLRGILEIDENYAEFKGSRGLLKTKLTLKTNKTPCNLKTDHLS